MSSEKPTSWPAGDGGLTEKQLQELSNYAEAKGVHFDVNSFKRFEGGKETVTDLLDALGNVVKDFPHLSSYKGGIVLKNSYGMSDNDYAETIGVNISINNNAFRNRAALERDFKEFAKNMVFAGRWNATHSIAYHESGHAVINVYRLNLKKIVEGTRAASISKYAAVDKKERIAEAFSLQYTGGESSDASTIFKRCLETKWWGDNR